MGALGKAIIVLFLISIFTWQASASTLGDDIVTNHITASLFSGNGSGVTNIDRSNILSQISIDNAFALNDTTHDAKLLNLSANDTTHNSQISSLQSVDTAQDLLHNSLSGYVYNLSTDNIQAGYNINESLLHRQSDIQSTGLIWGGEIIDNGNGTVRVTNGEGLIRESNSPLALLRYIKWDNSSNFAVPTNTDIYIHVMWNNGNPMVMATASPPSDMYTNIMVGEAHDVNGEIYVHYMPEATGDYTHKINMWMDEIVGNMVSTGATTSVDANRSIQITSGVIWDSHFNRHVIGSFDSNIDTFTMAYADGGDGFERINNQTIFNNTHYNTNLTLVEMNASYYANQWIIYGFLNTIHSPVLVLMPQTQHANVSDAISELPPSIVPREVEAMEHAVYLAQITYQKGSNDTLVKIIKPTITSTTGTAASSIHNEQAGLQGGSGTQRYHLTLAEISQIPSITGTSTQFWRGDGIWSAVTPSLISGFSSAVRTNISSTSGLVQYDSGTGVISDTINTSAQLASTSQVTGLISALAGKMDLVITSTKGDLIVRNTTVNTRLPVGTNYQVPIANSSDTNGITWGLPNGTLLGRQVITSGTTYTPTTGTKRIMLEMWGGGGAGGGCSVNACAGGGGGSGGFARAFVNITSPSYIISIGAAGVSSAGAIGGNGGNTTFNTGSIVITAYGGLGGSVGVLNAFNIGGAGAPISTNGGLNGAGSPGDPGQGLGGGKAMSGNGGSTSIGGGGVATFVNGGGVTVGNNAIANTGSGGSGASCGAAGATAGGNGSVGVIYIWEFT